MAESPSIEHEPLPSSSDVQPVVQPDTEKKEDDGAPPIKRRRISTEASDRLEHRLGGILCCAVCLDLPRAAVYQCTNGHLMCAPCFTHLLADARLRDEAATCPNCRIEISKSSASRNLAVEKTVSELPSECQFCAGVFPRHSLQHHEEVKCEERPYKFSQIVVGYPMKRDFNVLNGLVRIVASVYHLVLAAVRRSYFVRQLGQSTVKRRKYQRLTGCRFACIGCGWRGPAHSATDHEAGCSHPHKSASDVVDLLLTRERQARDSTLVYTQLLDLLSYEKITFNDLQLRPYRTDEFVHKLYYESARFTTFNNQWTVKAFVNNNQRDPTQSYERELTYQLVLKTKPVQPLCVHYVALRGPYGEADVAPRIHSHTFTPDEAPETHDLPTQPRPLLLATDTNRLLCNKAIHVRLLMFLLTK